MHSKKALEDLKIIANIDKQILDALKRKIGYNRATDLLATTVVSEEPDLQLEGSYQLASIGQPTPIPLRNIDGSAYISTSFVSEGVNQHLDNDYLFISLAPENVHTKIAAQFEKPFFDEEADYVVSEAAITVGEIQAKDTFASIRNKHPGKEITLLVLGHAGADRENISVYRNFYRDSDVEFLDTDELITKCTLGKRRAKTEGLEKLAPEGIMVSLYYLTATNTETELTMDLSSCTLETLYTIYRDTIAEKNPLLIHCDKGLDRAAIIAFTFEILRNFGQIFNSTEISAIVANLNICFDRLRRSRSPHLLRNAKDLSQAFHLALALKAIDLEFQCTAKLKDVIRQNQANTEFASTKAAIKSLLKELKELPTDKDRVRVLGAKFFMVPELSTHYNLKSLPLINSKLRSRPEYYTLLQDLKEILSLKTKVEQKAFDACNTLVLASKCEEIRVERYSSIGESEHRSVEERYLPIVESGDRSIEDGDRAEIAGDEEKEEAERAEAKARAEKEAERAEAKAPAKEEAEQAEAAAVNDTDATNDVEEDDKVENTFNFNFG